MGRYRQIASALARHGMGYLVGVLGLERFVPFHRGLLGHARRATPYSRPEHLRLALEALGTTFIKLGQILIYPCRPSLARFPVGAGQASGPGAASGFRGSERRGGQGTGASH